MNATIAFSNCQPMATLSHTPCTSPPILYEANTMGWPKSLFSFFHKTKHTFFIFTNNFIDLDILSMSAIPHYWRPRVLLNILQCIRPPHSNRLFGQHTSSTKKLHKPLLTHLILTEPSPYTAQIFFCISVVFYLF